MTSPSDHDLYALKNLVDGARHLAAMLSKLESDPCSDCSIVLHDVEEHLRACAIDLRELSDARFDEQLGIGMPAAAAPEDLA